MAAGNMYLSIILVLSIMLIAYFAWAQLRRRAARSTITNTTLASYDVRQAAASLSAAIAQLMLHNQGYQAIAARSGAAEQHVERVISMQLAALARVRSALDTAAPTYANALAIYRGLANSDEAFVTAANSYMAMGDTLHKMAAEIVAGSSASKLLITESTPVSAPATVPAAPAGVPAPAGVSAPGVNSKDVLAAGDALVNISVSMRQVAPKIHYLGAALGVE
jgi:hypothetical protein